MEHSDHGKKLEALKGVPFLELCEKHGSYQQNVIGDDGVERWFAQCPSCVIEAKTHRLVGRAAIPLRFSDRELSNYHAKTAEQQMVLALVTEFAEKFADAMKRGTCLTLVGNVGTGKTHLACGVAKHVMRNGYSALYSQVSEIIRKVRSTWGGKGERSEEQVINDFASIDLLIMDEIGVQFGTEAEQITLFEIINKRQANLKPMILLSNLPASSDDKNQRTLPDYLGTRVFDRLREGGGKLLVCDWESYRRNV